MASSASLGDYVKVDIKYHSPKDKIPIETPFDEGVFGFVLNNGRYFPQLHAALEGLAVGDSVEIPGTVGQYNEQLTAKIPRNMAALDLQVGDTVRLSNGMKARITEVTDEHVQIDANPPFAGTRFLADIKLLDRKMSSFLTKATFAAGCFWGLEVIARSAYAVRSMVLDTNILSCPAMITLVSIPANQRSRIHSCWIYSRF
jgi:peptide-methionine (S)-S-oxide reductase